jgi:hypothetical protein
MDSWISKSRVPQESGEAAHWRALTWRWSGLGLLEGEILVTDRRVVFREARRLAHFLGVTASADFSIDLSSLDGTSVGSYLGGVANGVIGSRRLRLHMTDGSARDLFVWGAGLTAEAVEAALLEWRSRQSVL